jgi:hypothetical protein
MLTPLTAALDAAIKADALTDGHSAARAVLIVSIVPLPDATDRLGGDPGGGPDLGHRLLECLLTSWGAAQTSLERARTLALAAHGA